MAVVMAVMYIASRIVAKRNGAPRLSQETRRSLGLQVIARQGVGRKANVAIIRAGGKALVIGVTEQQISVLAELDEIELDKESDVQWTDISVDAPAGATSPSWKGLLTQVREHTVRKA
jgi:flagellar protein FliO/FliZ